jgi:hypothetical protein
LIFAVLLLSNTPAAYLEYALSQSSESVQDSHPQFHLGMKRVGSVIIDTFLNDLLVLNDFAISCRLVQVYEEVGGELVNLELNSVNSLKWTSRTGYWY